MAINVNDVYLFVEPVEKKKADGSTYHVYKFIDSNKNTRELYLSNKVASVLTENNKKVNIHFVLMNKYDNEQHSYIRDWFIASIDYVKE